MYSTEVSTHFLEKRLFDLRPLRVVLAAAEHLTFRGAAEELGVETSGVSRAVREFEDRIGVSLFERGGFGVRLTDAGVRFLEDIVPAMQQIEHAVRFAGAAGRAETGTVRIGVVTSLGGGFLHTLIDAYSRERPGITLDIRDGGRAEHLRAIRSRHLDVAFLTGTGRFADCDSTELWHERIHVGMSKSHPLASRQRLDWPDLLGETFLLSRHALGPDVRDFIASRVLQYNGFPRLDMRLAVQLTILHIVSLGQGVTLVAEGWRDFPMRDLVLVPLTAPEDMVQFSAVWWRGNDNPGLRRFLRFAERLAATGRRTTLS